LDEWLARYAAFSEQWSRRSSGTLKLVVFTCIQIELKQYKKKRRLFLKFAVL